ncbi:ATP-binding cassette domain-containing protein [Natrialbaceae archaeon A-arb3/5]
MAILEVENLRKEYGEFVAVEGSSFSVARGEVFGVVGPNGAGKTTTLKMLAGLVEPTAGTAVVAGETPGEPAMQRRLGFLPEESPLYEEMTAIEYLTFFADLYAVPGDVARERIERTLDRLDLTHRDRRIGNMSKGMKRKVAISRALVNDPDVLIFDEPASGLDPLTTNYIIEFTRELSEDGKTIVFSAHNLFHVESICDRIAVMNDGRIIARGTVEEIREAHGGTEYHVYATADGSHGLHGEPTGENEAVALQRDVTVTQEDGHVKHVVDEMRDVDAIREAVEADGGRVTDIQTETPSLEEIFLEIASEADDEGAAET